MLSPEVRQIYLEEIQPPIGYELDRALATTYSLDLLSLLMAPLSLSLFSVDRPEQVFDNPAAVIEALRKTSDKLVVFCQQGKIKIPQKDNKLFNYLEPIVYDVQPPDNQGVFHPKIWILRFVREQEPVFYRFLCLSRNLTFDNSWDTLLSLEGELREDRVNAYADNHPLGDFIAKLPEMTVNEVSVGVQNHIDLISEEIRKVDFVTPKFFEDEIDFVPLGIGQNNDFLYFDKFSRMLMVSPFLTKSSVVSLLEKGEDNLLISRGETLDNLAETDIKELMRNSKVYIMDDTAERPVSKNMEDDLDESHLGKDLSGLHAKLYVLEKGWYAQVYTGSANATNAGLTGKNVEFMVGLRGKKSRVGIEPFLGEEENNTSILSMLKSYCVTEEETLDNVNKERIRWLLENRQRNLSDLSLKVEITEEKNEYHLKIQPTEDITSEDLGIKGKCYPITLKNHKRNIAPLVNGKSIIYKDVSLSALTSFIAFELKVDSNEVQEPDLEETGISFVFNLPVTGIPTKRDTKILQDIIDSPEKFIQYISILLSDNDDFLTQISAQFTSQKESNKNLNMDDFPLLEKLLKAYSRSPEKIENVQKLIDDLTDTEEGGDILPKGFEKIWLAFCNKDTGGGNS